MLNSDSRSPSNEGGTSSRSSANTSTTSINGSFTSEPGANALGSKKRTTVDVDYENEMTVLTSGVIRAEFESIFGLVSHFKKKSGINFFLIEK